MICLAPRTRILVGCGLLLAGQLAPAHRPGGMALCLAGALAWLGWCRPPGKMTKAFLTAGAAFFLPCLLLAPLIRAGMPQQAWMETVRVPWAMFLRGMYAVAVSLGMVSALSLGDLHEGIWRLPLPTLVKAILVQIVHQAGNLLHETRQIAAAMAVRGASGRGRAALRVIAGLPSVWLPRVMQRAERVALVLAWRDYGMGGCELAPAPLRRGDVLALLATVSWIGLAAAIRLLGV